MSTPAYGLYQWDDRKVYQVMHTKSRTALSARICISIIFFLCCNWTRVKRPKSSFKSARLSEADREGDIMK